MAHRGRALLENDRSQLRRAGIQPLECRIAHHDRAGMGPRCHADLARRWNMPAGRALVVRWTNETDFWKRLAL